MAYDNNARSGAGQGGNRRPAPPRRIRPKVVFYGADGKISRELVDSVAQGCAACFVRPFDSDMEKEAKKDHIKASQLRKFYGEAKALELAWTTGRDGGSPERFSSVLPQIKLLKAKANYALGRNVVPECFQSWLCECVDQIREAGDFKAFLLHFEAVVGFAYGLGLKDND